ncbi:HupE/UreJ family protein [Paracoccus benzoatiresistens]|uniref:HupE/UreJ family protein n=1 Tax=Paracoccus benzoatiresistens TaxID=2997341 RepID=A0ABT4J5I5_9RHOB|nr:HupE/UreJ family protein [Paracoccus sp. EF6]MCZ0962354.1 HupE/UreJ family protein [Paracoccus sp. EF6]
MGVAGLPLPGVETGIAASAVVLGMAVVLARRPPLWVAAAVVSFFAVFHGHAHATEMPDAANPVAYAAGFVLGTGLLHLAGIALGLFVHSPGGLLAVRALGGVIGATGFGFLAGVL